MTDGQLGTPQPAALRFNPRAFLTKEWPYLLMLILTFFGVAYTSLSHSPMTMYWIVLAPFVGLICIITRWPDIENREERLRIVWTQALHWGAVLLAMHLMFVADVSRMMNTDSSALAAMTLLALGTFTAGVHIGAWRICLVGVILGLGIPAIAWLEQSALFLLLAAVILAAVIAPFFWHDARERKKRAKPASP